MLGGKVEKDDFSVVTPVKVPICPECSKKFRRMSWTSLALTMFLLSMIHFSMGLVMSLGSNRSLFPPEIFGPWFVLALVIGLIVAILTVVVLLKRQKRALHQMIDESSIGRIPLVTALLRIGFKVTYVGIQGGINKSAKEMVVLDEDGKPVYKEHRKDSTMIWPFLIGVFSFVMVCWANGWFGRGDPLFRKNIPFFLWVYLPTLALVCAAPFLAWVKSSWMKSWKVEIALLACVALGGWVFHFFNGFLFCAGDVILSCLNRGFFNREVAFSFLPVIFMAVPIFFWTAILFQQGCRRVRLGGKSMKPRSLLQGSMRWAAWVSQLGLLIYEMMIYVWFTLHIYLWPRV